MWISFLRKIGCVKRWDYLNSLLRICSSTILNKDILAGAEISESHNEHCALLSTIADTTNALLSCSVFNRIWSFLVLQFNHPHIKWPFIPQFANASLFRVQFWPSIALFSVWFCFCLYNLKLFMKCSSNCTELFACNRSNWPAVMSSECLRDLMNVQTDSVN